MNLKRTYSYSLHHAASRSSTPPGYAKDTIGNEFWVLIDFLDSSFDFEKKSTLSSLIASDTDVTQTSLETILVLCLDLSYLFLLVMIILHEEYILVWKFQKY